MLMQKKIDRAMNWLKEKNQTQQNNQENEDMEKVDPRAEWLTENNNQIELEKGDGLAIALSALIVFGPILLIFIIIAIISYPG